MSSFSTYGCNMVAGEATPHLRAWDHRNPRGGGDATNLWTRIAHRIMGIRLQESLSYKVPYAERSIDMTPAEYLMRERDKREVFDSILRLVPSNVEAPLDELPDEIWKQLEKVGIDARDVLDSYSIVVQQIDWAKDCYARMVKSLPAEERAMLQPSEALVVGAVYDAEFNGYVKRCEPGFAICIS